MCVHNQGKGLEKILQREVAQRQFWVFLADVYGDGRQIKGKKQNNNNTES